MKSSRKLSVGVGITSRCNFNCAHCYSRNLPQRDMTYNEAKDIIERPGSDKIESVNFGTGESALNPDFIRIVDLLVSRGIKVSLTSNGYSVRELSPEHLRMFNDIDISLDSARPWQNDIFRDSRSYDYALSALEKCKDSGVEVSIVTCMTNKNFEQMLEILAFAQGHGVNLRVNIYKDVNAANLVLSYKQFWLGVQLLFTGGKIISCSEAIVNTVLGTKVLDGGCPCGKSSLRIGPDGSVKPCVYWPVSHQNLHSFSFEYEAVFMSDEWSNIRVIPYFCRDCPDLDICKGGCASSRIWQHRIDLPDPYCYRYHGDDKPDLKGEFAATKDLVHSSYLCTFIME